jgi:hypothetical protein
MAFAMAFFSITMLLNTLGVRISDVWRDLRPGAFVQTYQQATGRFVRYYENIRFVNEIEARVRELRRAAAAEQGAQQEDSLQPQPQDGGPDQPKRGYQPSVDQFQQPVAMLHNASQQECHEEPQLQWADLGGGFRLNEPAVGEIPLASELS